MSDFFGFGLGVGTKNEKGEWLEIFFSRPLHNPDVALMREVGAAVGYSAGNKAVELSSSKLDAVEAAFQAAGDSDSAKLTNTLRGGKRPLIALFLETDAKPASVPEAYFKLHLLSHRLVKPHGTDLSGIFALLPNVAWTNKGAVDLSELPQKQLEARMRGKLLEVMSVDKFPKMTNYVVPSGVRIAHTARVRLGAYIGEETTVMHEGFVNFNAGTEGPGMIEGRISAGVYVKKGSDLGGGCSTMGTLSGGGQTVISVGEECLIGANAGLGIPLGDKCTIESGLYLTAGSKVAVLDDERKIVETVKAADLTGKSDLLFRRNSQTGAIECLTNKSAVALNEELHSHN